MTKLRNRSGLWVATILLGAVALPGCVRGILYTDTTTPLVRNFHDTPVVSGEGGGDVKTIRYYVEIDWDSNAIGDIAKKEGFEEIYYADLRTLSILGVWTQRFVHVYGR